MALFKNNLDAPPKLAGISVKVIMTAVKKSVVSNLRKFRRTFLGFICFVTLILVNPDAELQAEAVQLPDYGFYTRSVNFGGLLVAFKWSDVMQALFFASLAATNYLGMFSVFLKILTKMLVNDLIGILRIFDQRDLENYKTLLVLMSLKEILNFFILGKILALALFRRKRAAI